MWSPTLRECRSRGRKDVLERAALTPTRKLVKQIQNATGVIRNSVHNGLKLDIATCLKSANNGHVQAGTIWAAASSLNHAEKRADFRSAGREPRRMYR